MKTLAKVWSQTFASLTFSVQNLPLGVLSASIAGESKVSGAGSVWFSPPAEHFTSQEGVQWLLLKGRPVFDKWPEKKKNNFMLLNLAYGGVLVFEESIIQ